ncbi:MAG: TIGR00725 family protein [candidate division Zixibacteria bacterium]|nr:TIGR00725 family protein [candidate division Zixibacteria bacterium]
MIGVIGGNAADDKNLEFAYQVGRLIAGRDAILICGGRGGIMEAACRGAGDGGGITVGVLPSDDIDSANDYVQIPIATGMGTARNKIIINTAEALIAIDGRYGTLSEIAFALDAGKKVIGYNSWDIEGVISARTPEQAVKLSMGES